MGKNITNTLELEIALKRAGLTKREVAKLLGISEMGLYKKINNSSEFRASEIAILCKKLSIKIDETMGKIFFDIK